MSDQRNKTLNKDVRYNLAIISVLNGELSYRKASQQFDVNFSTLQHRIEHHRKHAIKNIDDINVNKEILGIFDFNKSKHKHLQVFTDTEENALADYLIKIANINFGLTLLETKKLAYEYSERIKLNDKLRKFPAEWFENKCAGKHWMRNFLKRHKSLSIRKPENTSMARATAFNKSNVDSFFTNYLNVITRHKFGSSEIFNLDESSIPTVLPSPKIIAPKNKKQVGQIVSAERGITVTFCGIINANGRAIPPVLIFPRVRYKEELLNGAPAGSLGLCNASGWMTSELFIKVMHHLKENTRCSKENPILLLFDNHTSHTSIEIIDYARNNGIVLLSFPPHCTHRMQPLDVAVYGSFKSACIIAEKDFLASNKRPITIYDISKIANIAYGKSFTTKNILSAFSKTGIWPINSQIFNESDFDASFVTDRPADLTPSGPNTENILADIDLLKCSVTNIISPITITTISPPRTRGQKRRELANLHCDKEVILSKIIKIEDIRPFPKAAPRKISVRRQPGKSKIYTDSPERDLLATAKKEKITKEELKEHRINLRKIKKEANTENKKKTTVRQRKKNKIK